MESPEPTWLESRYIPVPECGCWLWTGATRQGGYGYLKRGNKAIAAHRYVWELFNGKIPKGMKALHHCDTPLCVNPRHIFIGTQSDNIQDMDKKDRRVRCPKEKNGRAKLSALDVAKIRLSTYSSRELGENFGVSKTQILRIRKGISWTI
jgi:hypothetical protein